MRNAPGPRLPPVPVRNQQHTRSERDQGKAKGKALKDQPHVSLVYAGRLLLELLAGYSSGT
jgi:hypothetical protein